MLLSISACDLPSRAANGHEANVAAAAIQLDPGEVDVWAAAGSAR
jgi:hypothetical protein